MASSKIKGIQIEIGGDTTKLGKAIESSEKKTRSLQVELRQVEKLLKLDPTNVELLTQKQNILADSILETSKKLDVMKEAEKQVVEQFELGKVSEEQLREFRRNITQTELSLWKMKDELKDATRNLEQFGDNEGIAKKKTRELNKQLELKEESLKAEKKALEDAEQAQKEHEKAVQDAKEELNDFGNKANEAYGKVKDGIAIIAGATTATAGYAVKVNTDFDQALNTLITKTGASSEEVDSLNNSMEQVYVNNFGESIEDVAESMATVKNNTKLVGEQLQQCTEYALLMRDVFEFDVNESARTAKMMMDKFGISAEEAYNLIAQGAQSGLDKNGDLLDTINEYSVHFKQLGLDSEDMLNMLVNGVESGVFSVDKLGDAVKEIGIRARDTADSTTEGFELIGLSADEMRSKFAAGGETAKQALFETLNALYAVDDKVVQNQAGVDLLGTQFEDIGLDGVKALMNLDGAISTTKDSLSAINEQKYDDLSHSFTELKRTLETDVIEPIGEELKPVLKELIDYVKENSPQIKDAVMEIVESVREFVTFISANKEMVIAAIVGIGTAFLTWKVGYVIGSLISSMLKIITLVKKGTKVMAAFNAVTGLNPVVIAAAAVTAAITGLIAAFIYLWNTSESFRNFWIGLWDGIKNTLSTAWEFIKGVFNSVVDFVKNNWQELLLFLVNPFAGAFALLYKNCEAFRNFIDKFVQNIKDFFFNAANSIVEFFTVGIPNFVSNVVSWLGQLPEKIGYIIGYILGAVIKWSIEMSAKAEEMGRNFINNVVTFFSELPGNISNFISNAFNRVTEWAANMGAKAGEAGSNFLNSVVDFFSKLPNRIGDFLSDTITRLSNWASEMAQKGADGASRFFDSVVNGLVSLPDRMVSIGSDIVRGVLRGIENMKDWFSKQVNNFFSGMVNGVKKALGIASPSKVFRDQIGKWIPSGIAVGIDMNAHEATDSIQKMKDDLLTEFELEIPRGNIIRKFDSTFNSNYADNRSVEQLVDLVSEYFPKLVAASSRNIVLDTGVLVGQTYSKYDTQFARNYRLRERGV